MSKPKMSEDEKAIVNRIVETAKERGVSMAQLSRAIGKSQNYMNTMKYGACKISAYTLGQLAKVLDVDPTYLITGTASTWNHERVLREALVEAIQSPGALDHAALCILYAQLQRLMRF